MTPRRDAETSLSATSEVPTVQGSLLARNAVINLFTLGIPLVVAFVTLPFMIRGLGPERFGVFSIVWLLLTYLSELGFGATTTRYAAEAIGAGRRADLAALAWTTLALQTAIGLLLGLALAAGTPFLVANVLKIPPALAPEARLCFYILAAALPITGSARSFRGLVEAAQRFDLAMAVQLPITASTYVVAAVGAMAGWSLPLLIAVVVAARFLAVPAFYAAARRALPGVSLRPAFQRARLREIASFAGWVAVSTAVSPMLLYLDRFMVAALLSMAAVTFYAAPYELVARLALIPGALVGAAFPALSQLSAHVDRSYAEQLGARCVMLLVALLTPVVVIIVGVAHDLLTLWLGADYAANSGLALQILALGFFINALAHVPYILLHSAGRPDVPARFHLMELPLQLVLAWLLISRFGITGAALAWTLRMIVDAALLFAATRQTGLLSARALLQKGLPTAAAVFVGGTLISISASMIFASQIIRLGMTLALGMAAAAALWFVAVSPPERQRLTSLLRQPG